MFKYIGLQATEYDPDLQCDLEDNFFDDINMGCASSKQPTAEVTKTKRHKEKEPLHANDTKIEAPSEVKAHDALTDDSIIQTDSGSESLPEIFPKKHRQSKPKGKNKNKKSDKLPKKSSSIKKVNSSGSIKSHKENKSKTPPKTPPSDIKIRRSADIKAPKVKLGDIITKESLKSGNEKLAHTSHLKEISGHDKVIIKNRSDPCLTKKGQDTPPTGDTPKYSAPDMTLLVKAVLELEKDKTVAPNINSEPPRRLNMTFSNDDITKIEKENRVLLQKIVSCQMEPSSMLNAKPQIVYKAPSAINRIKKQRRIEQDNLVLLQRLQNAKPSREIVDSFRKPPIIRNMGLQSRDRGTPRSEWVDTW